MRTAFYPLQSSPRLETGFEHIRRSLPDEGLSLPANRDGTGFSWGTYLRSEGEVKRESNLSSGVKRVDHAHLDPCDISTPSTRAKPAANLKLDSYPPDER